MEWREGRKKKEKDNICIIIFSETWNINCDTIIMFLILTREGQLTNLQAAIVTSRNFNALIEDYVFAMESYLNFTL